MGYIAGVCFCIFLAIWFVVLIPRFNILYIKSRDFLTKAIHRGGS